MQLLEQGRQELLRCLPGGLFKCRVGYLELLDLCRQSLVARIFLERLFQRRFQGGQFLNGVRHAKALEQLVFDLLDRPIFQETLPVLAQLLQGLDSVQHIGRQQVGR
ncbi:hypothetical protein D3C85_1095910 [compost metagenome]